MLHQVLVAPPRIGVVAAVAAQHKPAQMRYRVVVRAVTDAHRQSPATAPRTQVVAVAAAATRATPATRRALAETVETAVVVLVGQRHGMAPIVAQALE